MINLGIIIAVTEYSGELSRLPACARDGGAISKIVQSDNKFDEVLIIDEETTSASVKQRLIEFLNRQKNKEIGDVVFYFTGHGEFSGEEFHYLFSDYQSNKRKQTALENGELDEMVRSLKPNCFVKIVDACQSGVLYIKSADELPEYLKGTQGKFNNVYFMFSSTANQSSYQDSNLSYFTSSIIDAVSGHEVGPIRYKDIIDFVSDAFHGHDYQTPFFVAQADFTQTFCDVSDALKKDLAEYLMTDHPPQDTDGSKANLPSLAEKIRAEAQGYCSRDEAMGVLQTLPEIIQSTDLPIEFKELYRIRVEEQSQRPPNAELIGRWLDTNRNDKGYFFNTVKEEQEYRRKVPKIPLLASVSVYLGQDDYTWINDTRMVIVGFKSTVDMPFNLVSILLEPETPNLTPEECFIVPILSRTHLRLFWGYSHYDYSDWDKTRRVGNLEWATDEISLRDQDAIKAIVTKILVGFASFVEEPLRAKFGKIDQEPLDEAPSS